MIDDEGQEKKPASKGDYSIPNLRIQLCDPPEPWALIVKSAEKQDWSLFNPSPYLVKERKATSILYQGNHYCILQEEETPTGWVYRMNPWPESEITFNVTHLDLEQWARGVIERDDTERLTKLTRKAWLYEGFLGWLPGKIQYELSDRWHFNPEDASKKNAILQAMIFFSFAMMTLGTKFAILMAWFSLWGMLRWFHVYVSETGCGFFLLEIAYKLIFKNRRKEEKP